MRKGSIKVLVLSIFKTPNSLKLSACILPQNFPQKFLSILDFFVKVNRMFHQSSFCAPFTKNISRRLRLLLSTHMKVLSILKIKAGIF